jgi:cytochrome c-type biogenesis protein
MQFSGNPLDFLIAFFAGCLASFTPCVYPLIPVSAAFIVGNAKDSKPRALLLSLFYVTGVAITYSALGILAVATGSMFGKISSAPEVNLISGILILVFGLAMFDLFNFNFNFKPPVYHRAGLAAALLFGLVSGLIISPCLTPILGAILAYLSTTKNMLYGGLLLLSFSYGMGLIFIVLGTFGAQLAGLPKPGRWMEGVKKVCAGLIVLTGIYFIISALRRF